MKNDSLSLESKFEIQIDKKKSLTVRGRVKPDLGWSKLDERSWKDFESV